MPKIKLTQNQFALVDDADFQMLNALKTTRGRPWTWQALWDPHRQRFCAAHRQWLPALGRYRTVYMHRLITDAPSNRQVDHINGDPLDNRRENLRLCTGQQNCCNSGKEPGNTSGFKGVYWFGWTATVGSGKGGYHAIGFKTKEHAQKAYEIGLKSILEKNPAFSIRTRRSDNKSGVKGVRWAGWQAQIGSKGKQFGLGYFDTAEEAARAYDKAARELHGKFAKLNFP